MSALALGRCAPSGVVRTYQAMHSCLCYNHYMSCGNRVWSHGISIYCWIYLISVIWEVYTWKESSIYVCWKSYSISQPVATVLLICEAIIIVSIYHIHNEDIHVKIESQKIYVVWRGSCYNILEKFKSLFHSFMSFSPHINNIASDAVKSLNFVRRNLSKCDESIKSAAYLGLIRPKLEYASAVWDPHLSKDINTIERVQRIAARWVKSNYNWENSVSNMLSELHWPTLHNRRLISRLTLLCKGLHNLITLDIPSYITTTTTTSHITRFQHSFYFNLPTARTNHYHNSYFLKTFRDWNSLPISAIEANTLNCFYNQLCTLYSYNCDWIWENPASTHKYKYLEIPHLIIWSIITQEGKQMLAWNLPRFYSYL